jgi:phosphate transport system substrate-binding protein
LTRPSRLIGLLALAILLPTLAAHAFDELQRRHLFLVGSSTTFPVISAATERIQRAEGGPVSVVEATGTGGGFKLFCAGLGLATPDIVMASRRMKDSERALCRDNGVDAVREVRIGYDGIVIAKLREAVPMALTSRALHLALAREVPAADGSGRLVANPYTRWDQIDPALPAAPIRVLGPPPTSGTRDILVERLMHAACLEVPALAPLAQQDPEGFARRCYTLREDGYYVNAGENDARLVRKLLGDPGALGILGYNFLDRNRDRLQGAPVDGVAPTFESIESGEYPLTRPLYLYLKEPHLDVVPGLAGFFAALTSPEAIGPEGYLVEQGLIPLRPGD